ncbi:MAG: acyl carrier protein [Planctomycetia bacterium]|nr:acyl carrier protein [Planctomycetia bacterium]
MARRKARSWLPIVGDFRHATGRGGPPSPSGRFSSVRRTPASRRLPPRSVRPPAVSITRSPTRRARGSPVPSRPPQQRTRPPCRHPRRRAAGWTPRFAAHAPTTGRFLVFVMSAVSATVPPLRSARPPIPGRHRTMSASEMTREQLSAIVLELLEKETGETYPNLDERTSLREGLNLDSLDMAGLLLHTEGRFGIQIETELLESINTVGDLLNVLQKKIAAKDGRSAA